MPWQKLSPLDDYRLRMMHSIMADEAPTPEWGQISGHMRRLIGASPSASDVFRLGDALSDAFRAPAALMAGRGQGVLSRGGTVWERLVVWYLNLASFGTEVIATTKHRERVPSVLRDAVSVSIHNRRTNTEADVFVFTVPTADLTANQLRVRHLDEQIRADRNNQAVVVLQCKTNWNDNAQIPMLWDIIYRSLAGRNLPNIHIGTNGTSVLNFQKFAYSFVTVPTNDVNRIGANSLAVARVSGLSGGNYWGRPTTPGVSTGFSDFLTHHFSGKFRGGIESNIARQMVAQPDLVDRFLNCNFVDP